MPHSSRDDGCDELFFPLGGMMFWTLSSSLALGLAGVIVYLYYLRKGQFDDPEDVKYQIFRNEDLDA